MTTQQETRPRHVHEKGYVLLRLIGLAKLLKSAALLLGAMAALKLVHRDLVEEVLRWARRLHIAPGNIFVQALVRKALHVTPKNLKVLAGVLAGYAVLFAIEGTGLLLMKRWAEWMTVISTAGLIPFEIYEIHHKPDGAKIAMLVVNVVIAVYLVFHVRRQMKAQQH